MQLIGKFNKGLKFLLCVIDIFNKYTWVVPLTLICINWVSGDTRTIFLVTSFTGKMPESSDSMYSSIFMLENI